MISFEYLIIVNDVSVLLRIRRRKQKSAVVFEFGLVEVRRLSDTQTCSLGLKIFEFKLDEKRAHWNTCQ